MRMARPILCLAAALTLVLAGCTSFDDAFQSGKKFYFTHINTPSTFDGESGSVVLEGAQRHLVQRVMPIDEELTRLEKALDALATPPDGTEAANFLKRFPWLSGLSMVAPDGTLGASIPGTPLKTLDYRPLLDLAPKALPRDLRCSIQDTPSGPEVIIARPFLQENELKVILAATFDFRSLLPFAGASGDLVVRSADVLLWSGDLDYASTPMADVNWTETLKEETNGVLEGKGGSASPMLWITRYIGGVPVVFAAPGSK